MYGEEAMTFKIDEVGFYKMRNGEKCEVVHIINEPNIVFGVTVKLQQHAMLYDNYGRFDSNRSCDFDIISRWVEPRKVQSPEVLIIEWEDGLIAPYFATNLVSVRNGLYKIIERIPAHEITIND